MSKKKDKYEEFVWNENENNDDNKLKSTSNLEIKNNNKLDKDKKSQKFNHLTMQNSPINNELIRNEKINNLYQDDNGQLNMFPQEVMVKSQKGKENPVYTLCYFTYDDKVDLENLNKNGRFKITGYDRRVYNAVGTLWLAGKKTMTLPDIFYLMNGYGKAKPSKKQLDSVEKALNKLKSVKSYIDLTQEAQKQMIKYKEPLVEAGILKNKNDNIKSVVIESNMLNFNTTTISTEQGKIFKFFKLLNEPSLLTYNRAKGTLINIPTEYIEMNTSTTEKTIAFQDYLLIRIMGYKNGKMKENTIKYETLYKDSGITIPESKAERKRDRDTIHKILNNLLEKKLIKKYEDIKQGKSFVSIRFFTDI